MQVLSEKPKKKAIRFMPKGDNFMPGGARLGHLLSKFECDIIGVELRMRNLGWISIDLLLNE